MTQVFPDLVYPEVHESNLYFVPSVEQFAAVLVQVEQVPLAGHEVSVYPEQLLAIQSFSQVLLLVL